MDVAGSSDHARWRLDGTTYTATKALVIASGTKAAVPPIPGLDSVPTGRIVKHLRTPRYLPPSSCSAVVPSAVS